MSASDSDILAVDSRHASLSDFNQGIASDLFERTRRFQGFLKDWRGREFDRYLLPVLSYHGGRARVRENGQGSVREVIMFCSADYLGLARDEAVLGAAAQALRSHGASVSSVPAIAGTTDLHTELERHIADFVGAEACVLFPTGHAANIGTIGALCGIRDLVVVDKQIHYSFIEGIKAAGCRWESFKHSDPDHLAAVLERVQSRRSDRGVLVVVEGVYGIDGDVAPLAELSRVARHYGARLMVDDAHATGVLGAQGRGSAESLGCPLPDLLMGSLSKALGSMGGWIATDTATADYLRHFAKTIVFSVGLPGVQAAAASAALQRIRDDGALLARLRANIQVFQDGLAAEGIPQYKRGESAIHSVRIGYEPLMRDVLRDLFREGVWAEGLIVPAVPRGEERVRFRIRAEHERQDLERTVSVLAYVLRRNGVQADAKRQSAGVSSPHRAEGRPFAEIVDVALACAEEARSAPTWTSANAYRRIVAGEGPWESVCAEREAFTAAVDSASRAAAIAYVPGDSVHLGSERLGFLGDVAVTGNAAELLDHVVGQAVAWLDERVDRILAPAQPPLQLRGGGIRFDGETGGKPFLEPTVVPLVAASLERHGFRRSLTHTYSRHILSSTGDPRGGEPAGRLRFECLDRADLRTAMAQLHPVFCNTIARLPSCSALSLDAFVGLAEELRELILSDLWVVARREGKVVGFCGGFPNLTESFRAASGMAGTADLEEMRGAIDLVREGFLAWLAVDPDEDTSSIAPLLARAVLDSMSRRGMTRVWISWEVSAGSCDEEWLRQFVGPEERRVEYHIFSRTRDRR